MDEFLGFILELLLEALIEIAFSESVAVASRTRRRFRIRPLIRATLSQTDPPLTILFFTLWGIGLGVLSALIFPHPLFRSSHLHGISLLISPLITGVVMNGIGRLVRRRGRTPVSIESFTYGFTFAFAMALIRWLLIH
jgi:hypothetical protein